MACFPAMDNEVLNSQRVICSTITLRHLPLAAALAEIRRLGFTEREAKRALERASAEANRESAGVEDLLRRAIGLATAGLHERRKGGSPP